MKTIIIICHLLFMLGLLGCNNDTTGTVKQDEAKTGKPATTVATGTGTGNGIVGEWKQEYSFFDLNNNNTPDPEEKKPSPSRVGFDWFQLNSDGSCLWDKDIKFKGTYTVEEQNGKRKLLLHGGDNLRFIIYELSGNEMIVGKDGAFMLFKRV